MRRLSTSAVQPRIQWRLRPHVRAGDVRDCPVLDFIREFLGQRLGVDAPRHPAQLGRAPGVGRHRDSLGTPALLQPAAPGPIVELVQPGAEHDSVCARPVVQARLLLLFIFVVCPNS